MNSKDYRNKINEEYQEENPDWDMISFWSDKERACQAHEAMQDICLDDHEAYLNEKDPNELDEHWAPYYYNH